MGKLIFKGYIKSCVIDNKNYDASAAGSALAIRTGVKVTLELEGADIKAKEFGYGPAVVVEVTEVDA